MAATTPDKALRKLRDYGPDNLTEAEIEAVLKLEIGALSSEGPPSGRLTSTEQAYVERALSIMRYEGRSRPWSPDERRVFRATGERPNG